MRMRPTTGRSNWPPSRIRFRAGLHGRGCAGLFLGKKESVDDLNNAIAQAPCQEAKELMVWNAAQCAAKARGLQVEEVLVKINKAGSVFGIQFGFQLRMDRLASAGSSTSARSEAGSEESSSIRPTSTGTKATGLSARRMPWCVRLLESRDLWGEERSVT